MWKFLPAVAAAFATAFSPVFLSTACAEEKEEQKAPASLEELDQRIAEVVAKGSPVGLEVALVDASGVIWSNGYGYLDKEKTRPVETTTAFRAGSISKSFTGLLAEMLSEEGVLDLNAKLKDVVPEIEFTNKWEATDPVRLVHLSEHTTGWDDIQFSEYRDFGPDVTPLEGLAANPVSRTSRWRPGRYASYCNSGPVALAAAIEKMTGEKYEDLVDERIFAPLGIEGASFLLTDDVKGRISKSYSSKLLEEPYVHIGLRASGSLNISASELGKFVAFLIRRGEVNGEQLIPPEAATRIETPTTSLAAEAGLKLGYGLGNYGSSIKDRVFHGHTGGIDGFISQYGYSKETGTGFVIMSNTADGKPFVEARNLLVSYLLSQSALVEPAAAKADDLARYEGMYRQITPRTEFARVLSDAFDIARVHAEDGKLVVSPPFGEGVSLTPLGDGFFTAEGRTQADRMILTTPEGAMEMHRSFQDAYRRVSLIEAYAPVAIIGAAVILSALALLSTLIWILARPFGAFRNSNRWRVYTLPLLAIASLAACLGAFALASMGSGTEAIERLGAPSLWTRTIQISTYLLPIFAALGVYAALTARGTSIFARMQAGATSLVLLLLSGYLWTYGWIGMTVWSYAPKVVGV